jgi:hypothetical protein
MSDEFGTISVKNIFMKMNNSFSATIPVVYSGGDQKRYMSAGNLTGTIEFTITDANLVPLDLLDVLRVTLRVNYMKTGNSNILREPSRIFRDLENSAE